MMIEEIQKAYQFLLALQEGEVEIDDGAEVYVQAAIAAGVPVTVVDGKAVINHSEKEIWMPVFDNPTYEVSNYGQVRSIVTKYPLKIKNGVVSLQYYTEKAKVSRQCMIARIVYEAFHKIKVLETVERIDKGKDFRLSNLRLGKMANPSKRGFKKSFDITPINPTDAPVEMDGYRYFPNGEIQTISQNSPVKTYSDLHGFSMVEINGKIMYRTVALWTAYYGTPIGRIKRKDGDINNYSIDNLYI